MTAGLSSYSLLCCLTGLPLSLSQLSYFLAKLLSLEEGDICGSESPILPPLEPKAGGDIESVRSHGFALLTGERSRLFL